MMMKKKYTPIAFTLAGVVLLIFTGCGKSPEPAMDNSAEAGPPAEAGDMATAEAHMDEPASSHHDNDNGETPPTPAQPDVDLGEDGKALKAMGYMIGQQVGVQTGYTEAELEYIMQGIRQAWETEKMPPDLQEHLDRAKAIVQGKRTAYLQKQRENALRDSIPNMKAGENFLEELSQDAEVKKTASGLHYKILQKGDGKIPKETDWVKVNYRGTLIDGTEFDSSFKRNAPGEFALNRVVKGWTEGLQLVGEGGKIMLYVPSSLGYGNSPRPGGKIKAGDLLIFEIDLLEVTGEKKPPRGLPANIPPPPTGPPPGFPPNRRPPDLPANAPQKPPAPPPGATTPPDQPADSGS